MFPASSVCFVTISSAPNETQYSKPSYFSVNYQQNSILIQMDSKQNTTRTRLNTMSSSIICVVTHCLFFFADVSHDVLAVKKIFFLIVCSGYIIYSVSYMTFHIACERKRRWLPCPWRSSSLFIFGDSNIILVMFNLPSVA